MGNPQLCVSPPLQQQRQKNNFRHADIGLFSPRRVKFSIITRDYKLETLCENVRVHGTYYYYLLHAAEEI